MRIELHKITVGDIADGYVDNAEEGVKGYGGRLNIRPKYQREFVYDEVKRNAVLDTINKGFPLNVMYWVKNEDSTFEVLDGQQRTVSFCRYINGDFSLNNKAFHNLTNTEQKAILDYECMVYFCEGNDWEKLEWFKTINIAGEKLTDQELRNAVYTGEWLTSAKLKFSKSNCAAYNLANKYVNGTPIRQDYLETAISWINNGRIEEYMSIHQHDHNANELWAYFLSVINWVQDTFIQYRKEMKGLEWGLFYNVFGNNSYNPDMLEKRITELMADDDVTFKKGIYEYLLSGKEKVLSIRAFTDSQKATAYAKQNGICPICQKHFELDRMHADHLTPWHAGGKTVPENLQMLCRDCNLKKSGQE